LNLFPDEKPLEAHLTDLRWKSEENFTWYGSISGDPRSLVVLTVVEGYLVGTVLHRERMLRIKPTSEGGYQVVDVARDSFPDIENPEYRSNHGGGFGSTDEFDTNPPFGKVDQPVLIDMYRVDVLVAFTADMLYTYGGAVYAMAQANIDMTNVSLYASGAATRLRLVHTEPEFYDEPASAHEVYDDLKGKNDGLLDEVHVQRDAHAADIVVLLAHWDEGCGDLVGLAAGLATPVHGPGYSPNAIAFAVVDAECAIDNFVFSHEVGHLLGAGHDAGASQPPSGPAAYAKGYVLQAANSRSIMAYSTACPSCTRAPYYSNPNHPYGTGYNTSEPFGSTTDADNIRRINELTPWVASFR
jgi:hypothetical protein